ncbi:hypothetical protein [Argonema antarcticum]|uniref:hypothetical protein n=1 Tax=Argonema antarcticum TaxID=2942763 RepID=UPI0020138B34|nr:hypothetical protein [Argonema antarcticum]MCL1471828.1 hypothetical protein [Argonema antarcticum A004/B2]
MLNSPCIACKGTNTNPSLRAILLPDLDLTLLAEYVQHPNPPLAVKEFRQQIRGDRPSHLAWAFSNSPCVQRSVSPGN